RIQQLKPYEPGKSITELQREGCSSHIIKLASNENALGASPQAVAALQQAIPDIFLYPDGSGYALKQALAQFLQVPIEHITLGNGSDNILAMIIQTFAKPNSDVIVS